MILWKYFLNLTAQGERFRATSFESIDVHSSINVLNWLQNIFILILVVLTPTSILFIDLLKMQVRKGLYGYLGWNILGLFYLILFYWIFFIKILIDFNIYNNITIIRRSHFQIKIKINKNIFIRPIYCPWLSFSFPLFIPSWFFFILKRNSFKFSVYKNTPYQKFYIHFAIKHFL